MLRPTRFVVDTTKSNKKEAWRLKYAAPRLVSDSAFFLETFMHIHTSYVRPNIFGERKKHPPEFGSRDGHLGFVCKSSGSIS